MPSHFFLKKKEGRKRGRQKESKAGKQEGSGREGGRKERGRWREGTTKPKVLLARSLELLARVARHGEVKALWLDMGSRS